MIVTKADSILHISSSFLFNTVRFAFLIRSRSRIRQRAVSASQDMGSYRSTQRSISDINTAIRHTHSLIGNNTRARNASLSRFTEPAAQVQSPMVSFVKTVVRGISLLETDFLIFFFARIFLFPLWTLGLRWPTDSIRSSPTFRC